MEISEPETCSVRRLLVVAALLAAFLPATSRATVARDADRLETIAFDSAALGQVVGVRILLPSGYGAPANATRRYPVLFLLHGHGDDEKAWTEKGDAEAITATADLIVVMPDGGESGFYTNWKRGPAWESFHIGELVSWVDAHYRTQGTRTGRAIAGLSMGGYGALVYAARHPDLFVAAASFSGVADITAAHAAEGAVLNLLGLAPDAMWGPFLTDEVNWRDHNPPDLALNLRSTQVAMFTGNGVPRAGDSPASTPLEAGVYLMNVSAHSRFTNMSVAHEWHDYGAGTHEWHYWQSDLRQWLPRLLATFAAPPPAPSGFSYRTAEPSFSVWGWSFTTHRAAREFLELRNVQPSVLTAIGRGRVDVGTPPAYIPGATYAVAVDGGPKSNAVADRSGRLAFTIDLGPNHPHQQYTAPATAAELLSLGRYFNTRVIRISRAR